uniref:Uncharacterized protein n=1 Tax=Molossus molossus TaxID=27622 RepID=A0A7J8I912_MOLMO|nr:hypothetical protein HJG59_010619 [Molossus molossus]
MHCLPISDLQSSVCPVSGLSHMSQSTCDHATGSARLLAHLNVSLCLCAALCPSCLCAKLIYPCPHTPCLHASGLLMALCVWQHFSLAPESTLPLCLCETAADGSSCSDVCLTDNVSQVGTPSVARGLCVWMALSE